MSESQSRYSIVERLTQRKLEIISAKADLAEELRAKTQHIDDLTKSLADWETDVEDGVKRDRRNKEREIENAKTEASNAEQRMAAKKASYDEKVVAVEDALKRIEDVSKSAAIQSQSPKE